MLSQNKMSKKSLYGILGLVALVLICFLVFSALNKDGEDAPETGGDIVDGNTPDTDPELDPPQTDPDQPDKDDGEGENPDNNTSPPTDGGNEPPSAGGQEPQTPPQTPPETPDETSPISPDENGMMKVGDSWVLAPDEFKADSMTKFANKLTSLKTDYLSGAASIAYSVIPDKSFYAKDSVTAYLDHSEMINTLTPKLSGWTYVEIGDLLSFDDYLKTDGHWRQEQITDVANRLAQAFGYSVSSSEFTKQSRDNFTGDYKRNIGSGYTETISWLESTHTKSATSANFQVPSSTLVYDTSFLSTISPYDMFLGGPSPLVTVTNPNVTTGKTLVIFRDSFGSSMAPLLLSNYSTVILVDIRYMVSTLLPEYVDFEGADVLFLYSGQVVNNPSMLR